jgi:hypothetical protein
MMKPLEAMHDETAAMLNYREAAQLVGVPVGTLYTWVHEERIPTCASVRASCASRALSWSVGLRRV